VSWRNTGPGVCACQRAEELIINIKEEEKIGRFGRVAAERKAESAAD
jgi:hypothetical protein